MEDPKQDPDPDTDPKPAEKSRIRIRIRKKNHSEYPNTALRRFELPPQGVLLMLDAWPVAVCPRALIQS
jgi:hypothetical protein